MNYPIYEHFHAFQGEGSHIGKAAYFIRFYGCPLHCKWCDSAGTWHKDWTPKEIQKYNELEIFNLQNQKKGFIVLTGGEPSIFDLQPLTNYIHEHCEKKIHIETSGAFPLQGNFDWITVSPKWSKMPLFENIQKANEIKIIVENEDSINQWADLLKLENDQGKDIWLHPEWSKRNDRRILDLISMHVKTGLLNFRAGFQLHKLYHVDTLDENAKINIPLGGVKENGY